MGLTFARRGKSTFVVLALILSFNLVSAQDPEFSQFYANPMYTNPAFAGSSKVARGVINYRSQWPGISGTFRTFSASYDEHFDAINGGIGVQVVGDEAGVGTLRTFALNGIYSYQIIVNRYLTFRAGIQAGLVQKTIDFSKLQFFDQIVKNQGFVNLTKEQPPVNGIWYPNFAAGFVAYTNRFYAGFAMHNLTEPVQSFYKTNDSPESRVPIRYTANMGLVIPLTHSRDEKKSSNLWPSVLYMKQRQFDQLDLGMYYNRGPIVLGAYFRQNSVNSDAAIFLIGFRLPKLRFGFSYDATVSSARPGAKQSYEVSLAFELRKRTPKKTIRAIHCPEF